MKDLSGGYYEAIVQFRPFNKQMFDLLKNSLDKRDEGIMKIVELKTGKDVYVSSWRVALAVGRQAKRQLKAELITSRSLFTVDKMTSKRKYRVTVCLRFPEAL